MDKKLKILQINLNHCRLAHDVLEMTAHEMDADIVLIAEPLYNPGKWIYATGGNAAIWVTGRNGIKREEDKDVKGHDFAAVSIDGRRIISLYLQPNTTIDIYEEKIKRIIEYIKTEKKGNKEIYVGGDFNAKSPAWGANKLDRKGIIVSNWLDHVNLLPIAPKGGPTYSINNKFSNIDFLAHLGNNDTDIESKVLNIESASDHKYLLTTVGKVEHSENSKQTTCKWRMNEMGAKKVGRALKGTIKQRKDALNEEESESYINSMYNRVDLSYT